MILKSSQIASLQNAMRKSDAKLSEFRKQRRTGVREFVGNYYGKDGAKEQRPLNQYQLWVNTIRRLVAAKAPVPWIRPPSRDLHDFALSLQWNLAEHCKLINLQETLADCTVDGLYFGGHAKIVVNNFMHPETGESSQRPFVDYIDYEDWFHDCYAREWEKMQFMGDYYRMPISVLQDNPDRYDPDSVKKLSNSTSRLGVQDRVGGEPLEGDEFDQTVVLRDVWLQHEGLLVTMGADSNGAVLREQEWQGHPKGPYRRLAFLRVTGSSIPASLALSQLDLNYAINIASNRNNQDIQAKKRLLLTQRGQEQDIKAINAALHNEAVGVDNPAGATEVNFGGADPKDMVFIQQAVEMFSMQGGNLKSLAGLGVEANTLGQEELIKGSSNLMTADMGDTVRDFARDIMQTLAWYMVKGPDQTTYSTQQTFAGTASTIPFGSDQRAQMGNLDQYHLDIEPYSMEHQTPMGQFQKLANVWNTIVMPAAQLMMAQGRMPNVMGLLQNAAEYLNLPECADLVMAMPQQQGQPQDQGGAPQQQSAPAPSGERTYRRTSQSITPASHGMVQQLLSAQNAEAS